MANFAGHLVHAPRGLPFDAHLWTKPEGADMGVLCRAFGGAAGLEGLSFLRVTIAVSCTSVSARLLSKKGCPAPILTAVRPNR